MAHQKTKPSTTRPISAKLAASIAPQLNYQPRDPKSYHPGIALVGCGGITKWHLTAYRGARYQVVALCDVHLPNATSKRDEFYPDAVVTDDLDKLLARDDVEVVDVATHTDIRPAIVEAALRAGKHVLSQKPFVVDLDTGERLADLADAHGVKLAVNQNGRWAPHFSYIREAVLAGLLGSIDGVHCDVHWDHSWVLDTKFDRIPHLILYDFAIHWFDFLTTLMGEATPDRIYASLMRSAAQSVASPLLGQATVEFPSTQATLVFDGNTRYGRLDRTYVTGSVGTISSTGPSDKQQHLELTTADHTVSPKLFGRWFPDGFHGTMGELLCAIEEDRQPTNNARNNMKSLALCFAAVASAERGGPVVPGSVRRLLD